ncbi:RNA methyltransferase [Lutibacter sp.]|uniref:TrmH family RNA methyltransferase n=1 Tax=Lutibacter sp. TaxID=1925666 RepID=UPI002732AD5C|nr:RNA methyltransferase [Lutibacter sp.]MDP3311748.1 RNA methyltransferase [Lutibacter sp.]
MSLSKNQLKLIKSLSQKKYRVKTQLFIVEGSKGVAEFLNSNFELEQLFCVDDSSYKSYEKVQQISENELNKISSLSNPNNVLALFKIPSENRPENKGLILALDEINDPGNLGAIIRLCDWFGITSLICSTNTVDCYNTKVVQASMGSLKRVNVFYTDLHEYLSNCKLPIYGAMLEGENVHKVTFPKNAVLIMGNEANGICDTIIQKLTHKITIPRFGNLKQTESLNVATATAILLSEFRR